jgi:DNA-binding PadR family transcriptional regulator
MHGMDDHSQHHRACHRGGPRGGHRRHGAARGGFGGGFGPGFGRGRRAGRGDVRAAILLLLAEEPRNGYALMQELERRTDGIWRPSPGSVYPALSLLEDEGLVAVQDGGSGRVFELTEPGRAHVEERRAELGEPWRDVAGEIPKESRELRELAVDIVRITMQQVARHSTPEQGARAIALLTETRRGLYRILAGDDDE